VIDRSLRDVLTRIQGTWDSVDRLTFSESPGCTWRQDHPLQLQLRCLLSQKPCTLPYIGTETIHWVTFGGTQEELLEAIEDIRCWILPYVGVESANSVVSKSNAKNVQEQLFCATAGWYFRWNAPRQNLNLILQRFQSLDRLLKSQPQANVGYTKSLSSLRLEFLSSIRTGEWDSALLAVDLIDQLQLDTAKNSQLMRMRISYERGRFGELIESVKRHDMLDGPLPSRLREFVLDAVYTEEIAPCELVDGWKGALIYYRDEWSPGLAAHVISHRSVRRDFSLSAYQAFLDSDWDELGNLSAVYESPVARAMLSEGPLSPIGANQAGDLDSQIHENPPSIGEAFWVEILRFVQMGMQSRVKECLQMIDDLVIEDPAWIAAGTEALVELFTDPKILSDGRAKLIADDVLFAIADVVVNAKSFPRSDHAEIYNALISTWVVARGDSTSEQDGQLLLGLVGAAIQANGKAIVDCEFAIRSWWLKRKVTRRLPWLLAALDELLPNHPNPQCCQDLWMDGIDLIGRTATPLTTSERRMWRQIGALVGFDAPSAIALLPDPVVEPSIEAIDVLKEKSLSKIAIVSLQERAARQAAEELRTRTKANVVIIASTSADDLTRAAEGADLILFVWASSTHAVYRAFDHVRDKVQYVQGTGPASIVLAAERWVLMTKLRMSESSA
jgi:hypothetical protein